MGMRMTACRQIGRWLLPLLLAVFFAFAFHGAAEACPTCKDTIAENDPQNANLVRGYFWSIVFMMSMPFLITASLGAYMYWEVRRARLARQALGDGASGGDARRREPSTLARPAG
jgi:hypothetical protein